MAESSEAISSQKIGRRDLRFTGWFNADDRELAPGLVISKGMQIVDVGCGPGQYSKFCARLGAHVTAFDIDEANIVALRATEQPDGAGTITAITSNCDPIPLADNFADLVICTEVLEHVDSPEQLCAELARIAKPGATLLLAVPDERSETLIKDVVAPIYFESPNHIRVFSRQSFIELVGSSGLDIVRHEYSGAFMAIFFLFKWATAVPGEGLVDDVQPMTKAWAQTWGEVMAHPNGDKIVAALNDALPKSHIIFARKAHADQG